MRRKSALSPQPSALSRQASALRKFLSGGWRLEAVGGKAGFTLVEVIVATSIITVGVLSTVVVANVTVQASNANQDSVVATNLAREGIELVRNLRDSNWAIYGVQEQQTPSVPVPNRQKWDCYPDVAGAVLSPFSCAGTLSASLNRNFVLSPPQTTAQPNNAVAALVPRSANSNNTKDPAYLICPQSAAPQVYRPANTEPCPSGGRGYYRRLKILAGSSASSVRVQSFVNWSNRKAGDIIIETYLTDWKCFSSQGNCGS